MKSVAVSALEETPSDDEFGMAADPALGKTCGCCLKQVLRLRCAALRACDFFPKGSVEYVFVGSKRL